MVNLFGWIWNTNNPKNIIIHHSAVSWTKNPDQFEAVKKYHINTNGWGDIGYHYTVSSKGVVHKGREENTVGAHCYQQNMNYLSLGIMLDGNFDIELPTMEQETALRDLLLKLMYKYSISVDKVWFHRDFASYKSCPGTKLNKQGWLRDKILTTTDPEFAKKWEGKFITDKSTGIMYYIKYGMRYTIPERAIMRDYVNSHHFVNSQFSHIDTIKIPLGE